MTLFARLYIGFQNRDRNLVEFFNQENKTCPPTLYDQVANVCPDTSLYDQVAKVCPDSVAEAQFDAMAVASVVLDGAVVVQMVKHDSAKTFGKHAHQVFIQYST